MTERLWDVPSSWCWVSIAEIGEVVSGGTPSTKDASYWGDEITWFSPADLTGYRAKHIGRGAKSLSRKGLANSSARVIPAGSVMFSSRAPIGYVAINAVEAATNQGFKSVIPSPVIFNEYLYYYLKASKQLAEERATGTTFKEISGFAFSLLPVALPPLPEQHRIVAKIEALFSELDAGQDSLTRAQAQLKLYRQSLLKAAFQGRLTADWRAANPDKLEAPETLLSRIRTERDARYKQALDDWHQALSEWRAKGEVGRKPAKPSRPEVLGNPSIPEDLQGMCGTDWPWVRLGDIAEVSGGLTKNQKRNTLPLKMKYLRVGNVYADRLDLDDISEIGVSDEEWESNRLAHGDLLIVEGNGSVDQIGRVAIWDGSVDHIGHQNHLIRVRLIDGQLARFFLSFLMSPLGRDLIVRQASSTSGLHTLSISKVSALPAPVPTSSEQARLLESVAAPLSLVDHQMGEITTALAQITALRQSILKQAFSGRLVPQDPADEPASALLARLRAVDATAAPSKRRKKQA